ncbi:MAG: MG2 domain-containing protein, partial [Bacteroidota bacterium]
MKSLLRVVIPVLFSISLSNTYAQSDFYSRRWSAVYKYELKVLTASALAVTDSIYSRAKREKNIPQLAKALLYQSKFALTLKEDAELLVVQKFEKEIRESKAPLTNLLESVLANVYWQYFKENRWKYYQRTETENKVDVADFCTWDTPTMFREIHLHFQRSLQNASITQKVSLATINDLLIEAENSKQYRPTLYDFLAHQALDFYQSGESSVTRPIGNFNINDPRYFEEFESMIISDPDSLSPQLQSLKIFQQLLSFHKKAKDTVAYLNLELERLEYLLREGFYTNRDELHQKALSRLRAVYSRHPMSASIDFELATLADKASGFYDGEQSQFKKREALELCDKAIAAFPNSDGAEKCLLLKRNILAPKLAVQAERFTPINTPSRVLITYTNVDSLYLSAYVMTPAFAERFYSVGDSAKYGELEKLTPQTSWAVALKDLRDHLSHQTEIVVPALPAGKYMLVARTHKRDKKNHEQMYAYAEVQATNLALLQSIFQSGSRYQVVDRNNGKPIEGADVHFKTYKNYSGAALFDQHFKTDKEGFFEVKNVDNYYPNLQATIRYQNEQAEFGEYYFYESHESRPRENYTTAKVFLFTDRSIYRPGQTVYFKGIMIKRTDKKSSIVPGQYVEVILEDVNGEEAGFLRLKTNHYGSFSGEFKLPATGLTGEYILSADEDTEGESNFYDNLDSFEFSEQTVSVEEYKRPTFEASFKPVEGEFALNDTVRVIGTALAYNGSKISNAKVSYHVKRTVRYPRWYYWYDHDTYSEAEEITFGETTTNKDGEFTIDFKAIPDEKVSPDQRPVFHYAVSVDVTDLNGETRNANSAVKAGYHSLIATINAAAAIDRKVSENTITITTENLNDQHVPAKGSIQIHKLQSPAHPLRARPWPAPDLKTISEEEFKKLFPHDAYEDESDPKQWKKGRLMFESAFDTGKSKEIKFNVNRTWELGSYIIELTTTDSRGQKVTDLHRFKVVELGNKTVADNQLLIFETDKNSYKVGELMKLKIGSASKDITVTVDIEKNHKIAKTYIEHLSGEVKQITIPVTENFGNGFAIHCTAVIYNDFKYEKELLPIVTEVQQMEIETITFKDKLQPGAKETWSFEIKGSNPAEKEAEVLASMYDASLDQFKPHEWTFNPEPRGT